MGTHVHRTSGLPRVLPIALTLAWATVVTASCSGGGGGGGNGGSSPQATITSVSVSCNPTSVQTRATFAMRGDGPGNGELQLIRHMVRDRGDD